MFLAYIIFQQCLKVGFNIGIVKMRNLTLREVSKIPLFLSNLIRTNTPNQDLHTIHTP